MADYPWVTEETPDPNYLGSGKTEHEFSPPPSLCNFSPSQFPIDAQPSRTAQTTGTLKNGIPDDLLLSHRTFQYSCSRNLHKKRKPGLFDAGTPKSASAPANTVGDFLENDKMVTLFPPLFESNGSSSHLIHCETCRPHGRYYELNQNQQFSASTPMTRDDCIPLSRHATSRYSRLNRLDLLGIIKTKEPSKSEWFDGKLEATSSQSADVKKFDAFDNAATALSYDQWTTEAFKHSDHPANYLGQALSSSILPQSPPCQAFQAAANDLKNTYENPFIVANCTTHRSIKRKRKLPLYECLTVDDENNPVRVTFGLEYEREQCTSTSRRTCPPPHCDLCCNKEICDCHPSCAPVCCCQSPSRSRSPKPKIPKKPSYSPKLTPSPPVKLISHKPPPAPRPSNKPKKPPQLPPSPPKVTQRPNIPNEAAKSPSPVVSEPEVIMDWPPVDEIFIPDPPELESHVETPEESPKRSPTPIVVETPLADLEIDEPPPPQDEPSHSPRTPTPLPSPLNLAPPESIVPSPPSPKNVTPSDSLPPSPNNSTPPIPSPAASLPSKQSSFNSPPPSQEPQSPESEDLFPSDPVFEPVILQTPPDTPPRPPKQSDPPSPARTPSPVIEIPITQPPSPRATVIRPPTPIVPPPKPIIDVPELPQPPPPIRPRKPCPKKEPKKCQVSPPKCPQRKHKCPPCAKKTFVRPSTRRQSPSTKRPTSDSNVYRDRFTPTRSDLTSFSRFNLLANRSCQSTTTCPSEVYQPCPYCCAPCCVPKFAYPQCCQSAPQGSIKLPACQDPRAFIQNFTPPLGPQGQKPCAYIVQTVPSPYGPTGLPILNHFNLPCAQQHGLTAMVPPPHFMQPSGFGFEMGAIPALVIPASGASTCKTRKKCEPCRSPPKHSNSGRHTTDQERMGRTPFGARRFFANHKDMKCRDDCRESGYDFLTTKSCQGSNECDR